MVNLQSPVAMRRMGFDLQHSAQGLFLLANLSFTHAANIAGDDADWVTGGGGLLISQFGVTLNNNQSDVLRIFNATGNVPTGSTILGYRVLFSRYDDADSDSILDLSVQLHHTGAGQTSENRARVAPWLLAESAEYGGENDLWGLTLTPAQINSGLEVRISVQQLTGSEVLAVVDACNVRVFYQAP